MRRLLPLLLGMVPRLQALLFSRRALEGHVRLGALFTLMVLGGAPACACGWWGCSDAYGYRQPPLVYGYRAQLNARIPSRAELRAAPRIPGPDVGLEAPIMSSSGILQSAMPARGPSLFGSAPAAPTYYYSAPSVRGWQQRHRRPLVHSR